ncbi:DNA polymerase III subunit delta' [Arcanobacterium haemolyticum]|uniref:DNA polymerase III, delta prime subunit n=1 Tax=Arcanobacterium haemolyticum (strain ATCC 9345 / DSM 20595 / CCM 5947 / CCUG 17215 / LMG 16163 / NBRC 15585 / NCTC 8452 / 11018) TaxID=644284 RepID=D7BL54_ARCHD|nr:DNA polymerase III subunit delta' [Arcanobacterium haemolyticum]ADH93384.1 DNA polymerase III, delta prime subunit [Arcanobacterium haemolyticum DSM 20595]QCX47385.1 DNA polymerase III subunit delta' [Arcanobacterium haemolyticum]SPT76023.1 DNA polymerase III subunit tau [Arcanobacterium haemolyticum]SQH27711.1 DNA polymerase III subunit tau [Arcanobacterium haemolyticum]
MSIFDGLIGQDAAVKELQRAADAARASGNRPTETAGNDAVASQAMSQAWLFTGPPGSGRSLAALSLAGALLCTGPVPGCGECAQCKAVLERNHPDVTLVSTDQVTISAEEVREYVARSYVAPTSGAWRIFVIEDADRMLTRTTNVLLKAIEEPGARTVWMLCTAAAADVLPTIRSRCRNINLVTPHASLVAELLMKRDGIDSKTAHIVARAAQSHIGVARALAHDSQAAAIRTNTLNVLATMKSVGDAALGAHLLSDTVAMRGETTTKKDLAAEDSKALEEQRMAALGLDAGAKVPASVRSQIKESADAARRRQTRQERDILDREMVYMLAFYRDVLVKQMGASVELINVDYEQAINRIAASSTTHATLEKIDRIGEGRTRLKANVPAQLVMESILVGLR